MDIHLSPMRRDDVLVVSKAGDVLTINDEVFDFTGLPDGATIPAGEVPCDWVEGAVHRVDGVVRVTLILPCGIDAPTARRFPDPILDAPDGAILFPEG
ncbi:hypothetical protein [Shinella sp.]|uniref:hypothetical protein n=1 Tax=Shinella sp. TaxID=1870904 RepID=UPI0028AA43E6|nr:hypothetical protein [Shinella sp.]